MSTESQESWAIVELLGHVTMAGRLTEEERFGSKMGRIDCPTDEGGFTTLYFSGSSVYRITAVSEAAARCKAHSHQPHPVSAWEIPSPKDTGHGSRITPALSNRADFDNADDARDDERDDDSEDMPL
jgi:hypothetical protein